MRLCCRQHKRTWTKPLRGKNQVDVQFVRPELSLSLTSTSCSRVSTFAESWSCCLQQIHPTKELSNDFSSATLARGHADPQFGGKYPGIVRPTGLTLRTLLQAVTGAIGTGADSCLSALPDEGKEVGYQFDPHGHFRTSLPV